MIEAVPGADIRSWFRAVAACVSFVSAVASPGPAAADEDAPAPTQAHQQQFKVLMALGMGDSGPSNGSFELQVNRSWSVRRSIGGSTCMSRAPFCSAR